ncbi:Mur ligase family protein [Poseidonibacter ostreae]|mgnify:FL=1|jgi:UDP-N-acetylmuramoyl-tripeptide--D-alanyl-D-alanine ligase|uniref:UDP-N-acetylmuramoyl-tripeptide--D-alanyl-D-alanine ligase n=1 Tax=Poseidonibacter ostreae TaxID=2654171 RepID=A0A6L4WSR7_9BACT|nr:UDP-N-acetylmuramoyl-tripeptide--D-alanyl-D-alanine ligase [Poseidonibacter ostreae]KAB7885132.1 UDP-N-acetylmuramoyl-tripeptide--D-alanyl-D-alanine ligase [Poseidonibacter ostreae]KAB7888838.1 UDP-N-acetylmuramoyl-tripeptide--D-alanyl-D-alanine ligase [Poseidonibacter ostreae]KAB7891235.1 UDP-N-acetylmuramoyl-tripeptide--D-alanyl-D-alanine ligase [Poseidonibacter ostreae]MAC82984.1 UDP-N-acetylmuramoylalanyl-D-glutamyl-2, 6-diaminopimelate--D-alanyl-D-alanine ligase [Arcobacter sp.]|tara:strand:- start:1894 stop:3330 length:1437 start_codon:yes stop_codon:yes gene_type:complete
MEYFNLFTQILLIMSLGYYLITNLQWYNYRLERVILKHHKWQWHITYFITPIVLFYLIPDLYYSIYFYALFMTSFIMWNRKLDRPVVLTSRVKRFLAILLFATFAISALCLANPSCNSTFVFIPLIIAYAGSFVLEKIFFISFKHKGKQRVHSIAGLKIIAITASFGKTSIKNYLHHVLKNKYKTYKTPRSVNTIGGIVLDVNRDIPLDTQIYIAEAGAREKGDIEEIALFLEPQICIIGSVGEQHIEYFKTLDNIIHTKMELLKSPRMQKGFVHESVPIKDYDTITKFPNNLHITKSSLDGIWFDVEVNGTLEHFHAPILGSFNAINLTAVILVAYELGMSIDEIKLALKSLPQVEHRLQLIKAGGKVIVDDSFNGNLEGMLEAVNICSTYEGRKVIITPGLVESTDEANILLAKEINEKFDYVILTGSLNTQLLSAHISSEKVFILKDKSLMETTLAEQTRVGDLILFANDAPNFI